MLVKNLIGAVKQTFNKKKEIGSTHREIVYFKRDRDKMLFISFGKCVLKMNAKIKFTITELILIFKYFL